MLRRLTGRKELDIHGRVSLKEGNHGDHWRCLYSAPVSGQLTDAIERLVASTPPVSTTREGVTTYKSPDRPLAMAVLVRRRTVEVAFPAICDGPEWPIKITEVMPWRGGLEGQIIGTCMDAAVSFYDTGFHAHSGRYAVGETHNFRMGAFAYMLRPAHDMEAESEPGVKVSFKGAHAYMPANIGGAAADIDDYWIHSPLQAAPTYAIIDNIKLTGYPIILALPNNFEMSLTLYAAPHAEAPGVERVAVGDDLQGYLWLQGRLSESSHCVS